MKLDLNMVADEFEFCNEYMDMEDDEMETTRCTLNILETKRLLLRPLTLEDFTSMGN